MLYCIYYILLLLYIHIHIHILLLYIILLYIILLYTYLYYLILYSSSLILFLFLISSPIYHPLFSFQPLISFYSSLLFCLDTYILEVLSVLFSLPSLQGSSVLVKGCSSGVISLDGWSYMSVGFQEFYTCRH